METFGGPLGYLLFFVAVLAMPWLKLWWQNRQKPSRPTPQRPVVEIKSRKQEIMEEHAQDGKPQDLLEAYAEARHDVEMLQMFLQALSVENPISNLNMQQVIGRAIVRAEQDAERLKHRYERGES